MTDGALDARDDDKPVQVARNFRHACLDVGGAAITFGCLHWSLDHLRSRTRMLSQLPSTKICMAIVNVLYSGPTGLRVLTSTDFVRDIVTSYPRWLHRGFMVFAGYTLYDLLFMLKVGKVDSAVLIHHVAGLAGSVASMSIRRLSFFPGVTLFTEFSLISVYWLQYIKAHPRKFGSSGVVVAHVSRVASTLLFRTFLIPYAIYCFAKRLKEQMRMTKDLFDTHSAIEEVDVKVPRWASYATATNLSLFTVLNLWWTLQICRRAQKEIVYAMYK